jgi:hypothetical protein
MCRGSYWEKNWSDKPDAKLSNNAMIEEHVEDEGSMYSPGMVELLQSMGFNFMHEFSESEHSEIGDEPRAPEDFSDIEEEAP